MGWQCRNQTPKTNLALKGQETNSKLLNDRNKINENSGWEPIERGSRLGVTKSSNVKYA